MIRWMEACYFISDYIVTHDRIILPISLESLSYSLIGFEEVSCSDGGCLSWGAHMTKRNCMQLLTADRQQESDSPRTVRN